jgi:hypothetical protein
MATLAIDLPHRLTTLALLAGLALGACMPAGSSPTPDPAATSALVDPGPATSTSRATPSASAMPTASPVPTTTTAPATTPPTATTTPEPEIAQADPEPFAMNLADKRDFVAQHTFEWCVGASLQMALNMTTDDTRSSKADQGELWAMARDRSSSPFGGANPRGWTATLNELGIGPYELVSLPSFEAALAAAAEAIRATDRPVGLVMWRGRHAWVMSGFESTADPRAFDAFEVTGIRVHDPLYPHGSTVWGKSPRPNSLVSPETLAKQFVVRDSTRVNLGVPPGYLLVLPVAAEA